VTLRRDAEPLLGALVDLFLFEPVLGVGMVRRNEMKLFRIDPFRVPKGDYGGGSQKVPDGRQMCKPESGWFQAAPLPNYHFPNRRSPVSVGCFRVIWV
jgi:hypothetical protein